MLERSSKLVIDFGNRVVMGLYAERDLRDCPLRPHTGEMMLKPIV